MTDSVRVALLDLRTIAPYRRQVLLAPLLVVAIMYNRPEVVVPALMVLCASPTAGYPFMISDRADLETLYAVLPLTRRSLVLGHYVWALMIFAAAAALGTPVALLLAGREHIVLTGHTAVTVLVLSWAAFALSISIQFPLFVRLGFSRAGLLATTLPVAIVAVVASRLHLHFTTDAMVLALLAVGGVALLAVSVAVATAVDPRRPGPAALDG